jgi:protein-tyrosine phosphatase
MAEAVFRHHVIKQGLESSFLIDSCGTGGWHAGEPPHEGTQEVLNRNNISWKGQTARKIATNDFFDFDHLIAMDQQNRKDIILFAGKNNLQINNLSLMLDHLSEHDKKSLKLGTSLEVPDPYYTGEFDRVFDMVTAASIGLLNSLK